MRLACLILACASVGAAYAAQSPCSLLTAAEVQAATGVKDAAGAPNKTNAAVCDYVLGATGAVLNVTLTAKGPQDSPEKMVSELAKRKIKAEVVKGIGDGGYWSSPGYGMQQMGAYRGSSHVIVTVLLMGQPEAKAKGVADTLLRKAVARVQ